MAKNKDELALMRRRADGAVVAAEEAMQTNPLKSLENLIFAANLYLSLNDAKKAKKVAELFNSAIELVVELDAIYLSLEEKPTAENIEELAEKHLPAYRFIREKADSRDYFYVQAKLKYIRKLKEAFNLA